MDHYDNTTPHEVDPWHVLTVDFVSMPAHLAVRNQVLNFAVSSVSEKVHRPVTREQVFYNDGMAQYRYEVTIIARADHPHAADEVAARLLQEGLISDERSVRWDGVRLDEEGCKA